MISHADAAAIAALDLDRIKTKLCHVASGAGWRQDRADAAECAYRRFLCLVKVFPGEQAVPSVDVDTFWHYHILDTAKYAADCQAAFGYFLHHDPAVGLDQASDSLERRQRGARMDALYATLFGATPPAGAKPASSGAAGAAGAAAYCGVAATAYCGVAAKAYCGVATAPAYCGVAAKAYCGVAAAPAYCGVAASAPPHGAKPPYCGVATKAAYCGAAAPATPASAVKPAALAAPLS